MINPLAILRWVYLGRIAVAAGIFAGAVTVWRTTDWSNTLIATLVFIGAVAITLASVWYQSFYRGRISSNFLYGQVIFDTLMVTAVVHVTQGPDSEFAPLYILVIVAGALLLPAPGGILIGALASILYFADILYLAAGDPPTSALLQITLFALIALLTGNVGDRLRRTGKLLGDVESQLRQLRLDTDDILRTIDTGVVTVDAAGRLAYMNAAAETMLNLREREWLGRPILDQLDDRLAGLGETVRHTGATRIPVRWFETFSLPPVAERTFGARTTALERDGTPWVTVVLQDITDAKRVEELNRRAERLQGIADLSASMAHEIKNPLASIRSAVEQITHSALEDKDKGVLERLVLSESDRLSRLLSQFIEYTRVEVRRAQVVDLVAVCAEAIELARRHPDAAEGVAVEWSPPERPLSVSGDSDLLHRVFFNLVLNGIQHAGADGRVRVRVEHVPRSDLPYGVEVGDAARITVTDSGPGVAQEDMGKIFDPFFTTRKGGSGLGLALVHRAVQAHRGVIFVKRARRGGAEFSIFLPANSGGKGAP